MRNQSLDILRGIAILLVIGYHYSRIPLLFNFGWTGVDLFFVLSGFLISGLLFSEYKRSGRIDAARFWIRRGFKIYPSFYVVMAITALSLYAALGHEPPGIAEECLFLQNYGPHIWEHTWSLAVEEHFYLILPPLLIIMTRLSSDRANPFLRLPWIFACAGFVCLGLRLIGQADGMNWVALHSRTHLRIDSLFAGVFLGYIKHFHQETFTSLSRRPLWVMAIPFLVPAMLMRDYSPFMNTWGPTALYIGYSCILLSVVERGPSSGRLARGVAYIGRYSYSIYLWHGVVWPLLFRNHFDLRFLLLGVFVSIPCGIVLSKMIEMPALHFRERLFPSRSLPVAAAYPQLALNLK
ncbi:MAG: acyltransferase [Acidobacteria bacterium]|nr:MAG: acyltransferase [Acidobacteriota bacterium]